MRGNLEVPFSELFADTVAFHGQGWAMAHYLRNGMSAWEFNFWLSAYYGQPIAAL